MKQHTITLQKLVQQALDLLTDDEDSDTAKADPSHPIAERTKAIRSLMAYRDALAGGERGAPTLEDQADPTVGSPYDFYPSLPPETLKWLQASTQRRREVVHEALYRPIGQVNHLNGLLMSNHTSGHGPSLRIADEMDPVDRAHMLATVENAERMLLAQFAELKARLAPEAS